MRNKRYQIQGFSFKKPQHRCKNIKFIPRAII